MFVAVSMTALAALFILQWHNVWFYPVKRGFDAAGHLAYADFIRRHWRVPLAADGWEMYQPPLYYFVTALTPDLFTMKLVGLISWAIMAASAVWFFHQIFKQMRLALLGGMTIAALPVLISLTPTVSNELFASAMISLALITYVMARQKQRYRVIFGVALGLALLSKSTALLLLPCFFIDQFWMRTPGEKMLRWLSLPVALALMIAGWFYLRNLIHYGSLAPINIDLPQFHIAQPPGYRDLKFFTDLSDFWRMRLYHAQFDSLWAGTYFSWFYDGHNLVVPVVVFSKIGALIVLLSLPLVGLAGLGVVSWWRNRSRTGGIFLVYCVVLLMSYTVFTVRYPFYNSVKGSYLASLALPFGYFVVQGITGLRSIRRQFNFHRLTLGMALYLLIYTLLIIRHFWYQPWWQ